MRIPSIARVLTLFACATVLVAGCNGDDDSTDASDDTASPSESASESTTPPPPPPRPKKDRCYNLGKTGLASASSDIDAVPCKNRHTTQTYLVDTLPNRLTNAQTLDTTAIADTVSKRCDDGFADRVGGDEETRTLARVHPVWFVPTADEIERGARWFRCDVTVSKQGGKAAALPKSTKGMLDADDALSRWGTCAPADTDSPEADATLCSQADGIQAVSVLDLGGQDKGWPGPDSLRSRGDDCETAVRNHLDNPTGALSYQWTYPTQRQWKDGRRYGLCWSGDGP